MADQKITEITENTTPAVGDLLAIVDDPAGTAITQKITLQNLLKVLNALTADGTPDTAADYLLSYDASAGTVKKVLMNLVGGSAPFGDTTAIVKGSSDATKLLRFEVDGFTTGTTRVITPPNYDGTIATLAGTETLTNKRVTKRVASTTDDATAVIDSDSYDEYYLTAIANNTEISVTGTPTAGQTIFIGLKDAGVSKTLTWTGITALGVTLPTATSAGKQHIIGLKNIASAWRAIAVQVEA